MGKACIVVKNQLFEMTRIADFVRELGANNKLDQRLTFHLDLILDELITNIISYGYPDKDEHDITLNFDVDGDFLHLEIIDNGIAFNPLESKKPDTSLSVDDRPIGGLGIYFAKSFSDNITYFRRNDENHLLIRFRRTADHHEDFDKGGKNDH